MIATFYSYKGGVGRSFCLANVAVQLARWGNRVLCVDWDLEAPGLHQYFKPWLGSTPTRMGVVELATAAKDGPVEWREAVLPVPIEGIEGLYLLPAGRMDEGYVDRVQAISWPELFTEHDLGWRFEQLAEELRAEFDFILIDSRTGITDIGGICTAQLPDVLVLCLTPNRQNLDGALDVAQRAAAARNHLPYDKAGLLTLPIVSRFDTREEYERARHWRGIITEYCEGLYDSWLPKQVNKRNLVERTTIPYLPYWSFGEDLPAITENSDNPEMVTHYLDNIAALLAHGLTDADVLVTSRDTYVNTARTRPEAVAAPAGADIYVHGSTRRAQEIRAALTGFGVRVARDLPARSVLREAQNVVVVDPGQHDPGVVELLEHFTLAQRESEVPRQLVQVFGDRRTPVGELLKHQGVVDRGGPAEVIAADVIRTLAWTMSDDPAHWSSILVRVGEWLLDQDRLSDASGALNEARSLHPTTVGQLVLRGRLSFQLGEYVGAVEALVAALDDVSPAGPDRFAVLTLLGKVYARDGRPEQADAVLQAALNLADGDQVASVWRERAQVAMSAGHDDKAVACLDAALAEADSGGEVWLAAAVDLAVLQQRRGHVEDAEALLVSAVLVPDHPALRLVASQHLASHFEARDDDVAARVWGETARLAAETDDIDAMTEAVRSVIRVSRGKVNPNLSDMTFLVVAAFNRAVERGQDAEAAGLRELVGVLRMTVEDYNEAVFELGKALEAYRRLRDQAGIARCLGHLAALDRRAGRMDTAAGRLAEARSLLPGLRGAQADVVRELIDGA